MSGKYTGIGSRTAPLDIRVRLRALAAELGGEGWTLRTGGASGADAAFLAGAREGGGRVDLFLPWRGFGGHQTGEGEGAGVYAGPLAEGLASGLHPAWGRCTSSVRKLHARNVYQVLGAGLGAPSSFLICWTPDGATVGGTATAIRLAYREGVPVWNLGGTVAEQLRQLARLPVCYGELWSPLCVE